MPVEFLLGFLLRGSVYLRRDALTRCVGGPRVAACVGVGAASSPRGMALQREHVVALLFGVVLGWLGVHLLLPEAPSLQPKRIYPSRYEIGAGSSFAPPIPREASFEDGSNASLFAECVERVESASTTVDDIVLAVLTTAKRHELIETLREHWLRDAKALLLTDAPGLVRRCPPRQSRVPWPLAMVEPAIAVARLLSGCAVLRSGRRPGRRWSCGRATPTAARPTAARLRCTTPT